MLKVQTFEGGAGVPLLMAHGLFGSGRNFGPLARRLAVDRVVHVVDMRNHGDSPWMDEQSYSAMAGDLASVVESLGGPMAVFGHSMGGKAAMMLALTRPELVASLVVGDIAPVAYGHSHAGHVEAMLALDLSAVSSRRDADALLQVEDAGVRAFLLQSLDVAEKRWKLNLDVLGRDMDLVTGWPAVAGQYAGRVLFLAGSQSDYIADRGALALFPAAEFEVIEGAGHWLHADKPVEVAEAIRAFLA
ncbi:MAG: alpha/beta fold hydrolase [Deltaproteobacteria bacterium]